MIVVCFVVVCMACLLACLALSYVWLWVVLNVFDSVDLLFSRFWVYLVLFVWWFCDYIVLFCCFVVVCLVFGFVWF